MTADADADRLNAASFARQAAHYAAHRPGYPDALVDALAALAPHRRLAWDAGTGNGQLARQLAARFERVVATDASAEQIAQAPAHPRVEYRVAAAEAAPPAVGQVALVTAAQAVHWFDLERFWPRVAEALAPGGVVAVVGYGGFHGTPAIDAALERIVLARIAPYWARGNRLVWGGYRELPFPFDEIALPPFTLEVDWSLAQYLGYLSSWSAWRRYVEAHGDDLSAPLAAALAPLWSGATQRLATPLALRAGRRRG